MKAPESAEKCCGDQNKKKMKQARLPFQILSPGVKNPAVTTQSDRKRKASEDHSEDDPIVLDKAEVKENQVTQVEKKAKIIPKESDVQTEVKNNEDAVEEQMDVDPQADAEAQNSSNEKLKTDKKPTRGRGKPKKAAFNKGNSKPSFKVKLGGTKSQKTVSKTKTDDSDVVDLTDSPCKLEEKEEHSSQKKESKLACSKDLKLEEAEEKYNKASLKDKDKLCDDPETKPEDENDDKESVEKDSKCEDNTNTSKLSSLSESQNDKSGKHNEDNENMDKKEKLKQASIFSLVTKTSQKVKQSKESESKTTEIEKEELEIKKTETVSEACETPKNKLQPLSNETDVTPTPVSKSGSDSSPTSSASIPPTPLSDKKGVATTPRRLTPKQILKLKEKEEKKKEKDRLKEEKEKKKAEELEEKVKQKQAKEEERQRIKQEKEEEKRKEKEEKEKKKQAELEAKNEEKRLKEEEKRLKEEERRKKEEEERKKKEEKKIKDEKKEAEKRKSAQAFASFFVVKNDAKPTPMDEDKENTQISSYFQSFEMKADMRLAPLVRKQMTDSCRQTLDSAVDETVSSRLYLEEIHSPSYKKGSDTKTWPAPDNTDDDIMIIESELDGDIESTTVVESKPEKKKIKAKLLQFHENRRPPYWGTFRKKSKFIRPRAPLNQDKTMLEYEVDSDDEWEEPEDGESLRGSEDEESQDEQYEEDNDMFVPHGYLSDGEGEDEFDDTSPEAMKAKLKYLQMEFEAERNEKQEKLKPRLIGCVWFCNSESDPSKVGSHIAELFLTRRAVWEGSLPITISTPPAASPPSRSDSMDQAPTDAETAKSVKGAKKKLVNEAMMPEIIKKIHGSRKKLSKLLNEILDEHEDQFMRPSKKCLAEKIREIAAWEKTPDMERHCWYVKDEIRSAFGLSDICIKPVVPSTPSTQKSNITKFTKVLTSDERLKLLRELPAATTPKEVQTPQSSTPSQSSIKLATSSGSTAKQTTPVIKLSSNKSTSDGKMKKRVPLLISVPPGQQLPKQGSSLMLHFIQKDAKKAPTEEKKASCDSNKPATQSETSVSNGSKEEGKSLDNTCLKPVSCANKVKKRITPITLTTCVSKPKSSQESVEDDCVVLSD